MSDNEFSSDEYLHKLDDLKFGMIGPNPKKEHKTIQLDKRDNNSGMGEKAPYGISRQFNWGAFLFNWIWGIKYRRWILLLIPILLFIPYCFIVSIVLCVWAGINGNQWAWEEVQYLNEEDFHSAQRSWVKTWLFFAGIFMLLCAPFAYKYLKPSLAKKDEETEFDYYKFLSTIELNIPKEAINKTDASDNHSDFINSGKYIIYWIRPENELTLKNMNYIRNQFDTNSSKLGNRFVLYPDLKRLTDNRASIRNFELDAKCKNDVCIDTWLYKTCNRGYCIINPYKKTFYKVRAKDKVIEKAVSLLKSGW
ncbi:hypothetical protein IJ541_00995 [bacterium]|nr:hypothetical protein [bacterium]